MEAFNRYSNDQTSESEIATMKNDYIDKTTEKHMNKLMQLILNLNRCKVTGLPLSYVLNFMDIVRYAKYPFFFKFLMDTLLILVSSIYIGYSMPTKMIKCNYKNIIILTMMSLYFNFINSMFFASNSLYAGMLHGILFAAIDLSILFLIFCQCILAFFFQNSIQ